MTRRRAPCYDCGTARDASCPAGKRSGVLRPLCVPCKQKGALRQLPKYLQHLAPRLQVVA